MTKSKVFFTKEISPEALVRTFEALGVELKGKVAIKVSTGEAGNPNYLNPQLIKELVQKVNGTIVECNTAYEGARNNSDQHRALAEEHGFTKIADIDIMDETGEIEIPVQSGKHLKYDIIGRNLSNYDSMINLAHFKGHQMSGFGGVLKNQAIGIASASGKVYIHTAGKSRDLEKFYHCFDTPEGMAEMLPAQDDFLESMTEAAKAVADYMLEQNKPVLYLNVMNNLSVDCDCATEPEAPCMQDIGIAASLDPVALDQACIDMVWNSTDPGRDHFIERVEDQNGRHILEAAEHLGLGGREYDLIELDQDFLPALKHLCYTREKHEWEQKGKIIALLGKV